MKDLILALDQGTTGSRAILFHKNGKIISQGYKEIRQYYPKPGWVEHDPDELWHSTLSVIRSALDSSRVKPTRIAAIGITNQRETVVLWNRKTGRPVHKAIVWQDRRTSGICSRLKREEPSVRRITGLVLDPYFSGTKLTWLFENYPSLRRAARVGRLAFGTVESWLLWKLTGGRAHMTDVTNASRTLLYSLSDKGWAEGMLKMFKVPPSILPEIAPSAFSFGKTSRVGPLPAGIPITGMAGDQQAALFGQGCTRPGSAKNTYGTGCFLLMHTGTKPIVSRHGLITTVACGPF